MDIAVLPYSTLGSGKTAAETLSDTGFEMCEEDSFGLGLCQYTIVYNDELSQGRVRFTILHEIGHIVLGHREQSELAEAEADFFAKYAIAPPALVHLTHPSDYFDIAATFGISLECASYAMSYYNKWLQFGPSSYLEYEYRTIKLFSDEEPGGGRMLRMKKGA